MSISRESSYPVSPPAPPPRRLWPWVLLGGVTVTVVLAVMLYPAWLAAG